MSKLTQIICNACKDTHKLKCDNCSNGLVDSKKSSKKVKCRLCSYGFNDCPVCTICKVCNGSFACTDCDGSENIDCKECNGSGLKITNAGSEYHCTNCKGSGLVVCLDCDGSGECPNCT